MGATLHKTAREEYLARLEREDIARVAEAKAIEEAFELTQWRKLASVAINVASRSGIDVDWLRLWRDELISARTDEQWEELNEKGGF
jgi:hypothetical protein